MTEATQVDPLLETDFIREMVRQIRALDTYGVYSRASVETLLAPLVLTRERKAEIPLVGDPDDETLARVKAYYNAVAVLIEKGCGQLAVPLVHLTHEGFGRALITVGRLVAVDRTLRDVHRFGFASLAKLRDEGDRLVATALAHVARHPDVVAQ